LPYRFVDIEKKIRIIIMINAKIIIAQIFAIYNDRLPEKELVSQDVKLSNKI